MAFSAATVWRDYNTDGVPGSGVHQPVKAEIRGWGGFLEMMISGFQAGGGVVFGTRALANSNLAYPAFQMAWVVQDTIANNNGVYQKSGAAGTGSWIRVADLPYSFYRASNTGAGTPNAIKAANSYPLVSDDALVVVNVTAANTASPVTVSFNGADPLTIKTASGSDIAVGGITTGMLLAGYIDGVNFRLLSDQASTAIQAAAEAAQAAAEDARDLAVAAAQTTLFAGTLPIYPSVPVLEALELPGSYTVVHTQGKLKPGDFGAASWKRVDVEPTHDGKFRSVDRYLSDGTTTDSTNGGWFALNDIIVAPQMFLAADDDGDDALMFNRMAAFLLSDRSNGVVPHLDYLFKTQVSFTSPLFWRARIDATGATFRTQGAIKAFVVTGGGYSGGFDFVNFAVDHQGNTDAPYAWELSRAGFVKLHNPMVKCGATGVNYAAIHICQSDLADGNTGSFWNTIENAQIYSITEDAFHQGILIEGACNDNIIRGGNFSEGEYGIFLNYLATASASPNSVLIDGVSFEHANIAVHFHGFSGSVDGSPYGLRVLNCRAETVDVFLDYSSGVDTNTMMPTVLRGNSMIGVTTYINNSRNVKIVAEDYPNDLSGVATLAGTSVNVDFQVTQPSDHYLVLVTGTLGIQLWTTNRTASHFTINAAESYSGLVHWQVIREAF